MSSTQLGGTTDGESAAGAPRAASAARNEALLWRLLDHAPIAAWIADEDARLIARNRALDRLHAGPLPPESTIWDLLPPDAARTCVENNEKVLHGGNARRDIEPAVRADGTPGLYQVFRYPLGELAGRRLVGGFAIDITEQEQQRLANARLAAIVRTTPAAIVSFDAQGRVTTCNEGAVEMLGLDPDQVLGRPLFPHVAGEAGGELLQALEQALAGGPPMRIQVRLPSPAGPWLDLDCSFSPVTSEDGQTIGAAWIASDITEVRRLSERNRYLALREPQTGLLNEYGLLLSLDSELSMSPPAALQLVLVQARRLATVKDVFGHAQAERLAQALVDRMNAELDAGAGLFTRVGEDRFAWVLPLAGDDALLAGQAAAWGLGRLLPPIELAPGLAFDLDLCAGHARYPTDGADAETLLRHADLALSHARRGDAGATLAFRPAMAATLTRKMRIERHLAHTLREARERLCLHFQPIVDGDARIVGAEALARWDCEALGEVPPAEFIPLAEETGLIHALGDWAIADACRQLARWRQHHPGLFLTVNVSPIQLRRPAFAAHVEHLLGEHALAPGALVLEVTESALMDADGPEMRQLRRLGDCGLRLAIDDFGTGYSCLAHMKLLPLHKLKIDRRFVSGMVDNPRDRQIVDTLLTLGRSLDLTAVAEGVETEGEFAMLRELGCALFQGYRFAHPMPAADFGQLLHDGLAVTG